MTLPSRLHATLLALVAALVAASPAAAAEKPAPCDGKPLVTDPKGDQTIGFSGNQTPVAAEESLDVTQLWFLRLPDETTTANISVANLTLAAPVWSQGLVYRWFYTYKDQDRFLDLEVLPDGSVTYTYGHFETTPTGDGSTSGTVVAGPDGVLSIKIPAAAGGVAGAKFTDVRMFASYSTGVLLLAADEVPDDPETTSWNGAICQSAVKPLALTVKPTSLKARKWKKGAKAKKTTFTLTSGEELTDLVAKLKKGSKVLGTAKLATIAASGKISFNLKSLKKGRYSLLITATRPDGSSGELTLPVRVR